MRLVKGTVLACHPKNPSTSSKSATKSARTFITAKSRMLSFFAVIQDVNVWKFLFSLGFVSFFSIRKDREH